MRNPTPLLAGLSLLLIFTTKADAAPAASPVSESTPPTLAFSCDDVTEIPSHECEALVALYNAANGMNWTNNQDWLQTTTPCSWFGITCRQGHVSIISLPNNNLEGTIPAELGNLDHLGLLHLYDNHLTGPIPPQLGDPGSIFMEELMLHNNELTGSIPPELGNLTNLHTLWLHNNQLTGNLPDALTNLVNLPRLDLSNNQLTGNIPASPVSA